MVVKKDPLSPKKDFSTPITVPLQHWRIALKRQAVNHCVQDRIPRHEVEDKAMNLGC